MAYFQAALLTRIFPRSVQDFIVELNKDKNHPRIGAVQSVKRISDKDAPRSIWQIRFVESDAAYRAVTRLDGLDIDRKPIQVTTTLPPGFV